MCHRVGSCWSASAAPGVREYPQANRALVVSSVYVRRCSAVFASSRYGALLAIRYRAVWQDILMSRRASQDARARECCALCASAPSTPTGEDVLPRGRAAPSEFAQMMAVTRKTVSGRERNSITWRLNRSTHRTATLLAEDHLGRPLMLRLKHRRRCAGWLTRSANGATRRRAPPLTSYSTGI